MRTTYPHLGLAKLCGWFGVSRQAYYQSNWQAEYAVLEEELIVKEVRNIRKSHPRMGGKKLHGKLKSFISVHGIKLGRDALFDLLAANNLLVKKRKRSVKTTQSSHWLRKYPNLIKELTVDAPNQLWVSDITYWKLKNGEFVYISFITDVFSHKVVGWYLSNSLESIGPVKALKMALSERNNCKWNADQLIHHSDRGVQYCSAEYVKILNKNKIEISMTENGDPRENAVAERVNGIFKDEYLFEYPVNNKNEAQKILKNVVELYNGERPHNSIGNLTPNQVHEENIKTKKLWKIYYQKQGQM